MNILTEFYVNCIFSWDMYNNPDFFVGFFSVNRGFWTVISLEKYLRIVTQHTSKRQFPNYLLPFF